MPSYYMKLTDAQGLPLVTGDVKAKGHEGWIRLTSVQLATPKVSPGRSAGRDPGGPKTIVVTKNVDSTSTFLFHLAAYPRTGRVVCTIDFVADGSTAAYQTVEILDSVIFASSKSRDGEQLDFVGDQVVFKTKSAPPPPPPTPRSLWNDWPPYYAG